MQSVIELAAGRWRAELRPETGGCIAALECDGLPILRGSMPAESHDVLHSSCFPLVPYCNRIADGRFTFAGHDVTLSPNLPPQRHPLHGTGWKRSWRILQRDAASAVIADDCPAGEWPWATRACQSISLDPRGCTIRLVAENRAMEPAPLGLGLHPYFRRSADTVVTFTANRMLCIDAEFLPDGASLPADALASWSAGAPLPDTLVDNCFTGWSGTASIADSHGVIRLSALGGPCCHLFAPPGSSELGFEPVNHTPDALNRDPQDMPLVLPGRAAAITMRIEADS